MMKAHHTVAPLVALVLVLLVNADDSIVQIETGLVQGTVNNHNRQFLGIPFAKPPLGSLRWAPPQPAKSWEGVKETKWFGSSCVQGADFFTLLTNISEDCLYLNVFTPKNNKTGLPVMFFLYGGSWKYGAATILYDGGQLIDDLEDVVIVTTNYRLGEFGFLGSEVLRKANTDGSTGNWGLQDQRFALQWTIRNIEAFGGDPNNILLFGESAGAGSVTNHLVAPRSKGLFQRALMESGPFAVWTAQPLNISQEKFDALNKHVGCSGVSDVVACLRSKNTSEIAEGAKGLPSGLLEWSPVVDGVEILDDPQKLAAEGKIVNKVPTLLGTNKNEGTMFDHIAHDGSIDDLKKWLTDHFGANVTAKVMELYPVSNYKSPWWTLAEIVGDAVMTCPARRSARWLTAVGADVYQYYYTHELEVVKLFVPYKGCFHGSELVMVFDVRLGQWTSGERSIAKAFGDYWTSFAANGNPNNAEQPTWPRYNATNDYAHVLDTNITTVSGLKAKFCDFWDGVTIAKRSIFEI